MPKGQQGPIEPHVGTPSASGTPGPIQHPADHSWLLQMMMELQGTVRHLEGRFDERTEAIQRSVGSLKDDLGKIREEMRDLPKKSDIRWTVTTAVAIVGILVAAVVGLARLLSPPLAQPPTPSPPAVQREV